MPNSMPSFFANPFMTPFMPQQLAAVAAAASTTAPGASPSPDQDCAEYRSNPLQPDSYLLQSLQCQEIMQHYIQSLMAAASRLPSTGIDASPAQVSSCLPFLSNLSKSRTGERLCK
ncbi:unnamed protein product [Gongylonema pulchrum]|uniref:Uncharacterized protein n=1 Tax=Gongylonema pulchrum TaxID=637853 RepID=A0A183D2N5_9BILA|nr:unnamed protein product [Gongylonema pulchrum]